MKKDKENKTSNLAIYERNLKRNYALKGGIVGVELSAIPLSIAVANNVFGMHVIIQTENNLTVCSLRKGVIT